MLTPGVGTTDRTHRNAVDLMHSLGVTAMEVNISKAVTQHFSDIEHDPSLHDITYENSQARERTQILMDKSNQLGGIVIGTGDNASTPSVPGAERLIVIYILSIVSRRILPMERT